MDTIPSSKADPGPARRARAPWFEKKLGFVFVNFDYISRIYIDFSQHTMFTIVYNKNIGYCEGASNQTQDLRIVPNWDRAPRF